MVSEKNPHWGHLHPDPAQALAKAASTQRRSRNQDTAGWASADRNAPGLLAIGHKLNHLRSCFSLYSGIRPAPAASAAEEPLKAVCPSSHAWPGVAQGCQAKGPPCPVWVLLFLWPKQVHVCYSRKAQTGCATVSVASGRLQEIRRSKVQWIFQGCVIHFMWIHWGKTST